jgi:hypothetical protein
MANTLVLVMTGMAFLFLLIVNILERRMRKD